MSFKILGTGGASPGTAQGNGVLTQFVDTDDQWIRERTGIEERHICITAKLTDIAYRAALDALEESKVDAKELDLIICTTIGGDYVTPSMACLIQKEIGATCPAFDINAACSGFIYALDLADSYFRSGKVKKVLIVSAEAMSRRVDWHDRATCVLFGDGAGAVVLGEGDDLKAIQLTARGDLNFLRIPVAQGNSPFTDQFIKPTAKPLAAIVHKAEVATDFENPYLIMDGQEVYKFAVSTMCKDIVAVAALADLSKDEIDLILPHQANLRIINAAKTRLKIPMEKFMTNLQEYGNTSSASIPLLLNQLNKRGKLKAGMNLVLSAFGAGLTTGACVIRWSL